MNSRDGGFIYFHLDLKGWRCYNFHRSKKKKKVSPETADLFAFTSENLIGKLIFHATFVTNKKIMVPI